MYCDWLLPTCEVMDEASLACGTSVGSRCGSGTYLGNGWLAIARSLASYHHCKAITYRVFGKKLYKEVS